MAQISVVKSSSTQDIQSVGQVVPYEFVVTNTGTTTLSAISVNDTQSAPSLDTSLSSISCPSSTLAAGDHETCTADYTVTAADLANGSVADSATASGTPPVGPGRYLAAVNPVDSRRHVDHHKERQSHGRVLGRFDDHLHLCGHQHRRCAARRTLDR